MQALKTGTKTTGSTNATTTTTKSAVKTVKTAKTIKTAMQGTVTFVCGGQEVTVNTAVGKTAAAMKAELKTKLGLTKAHSTTYVNGETAAAGYRLQSGDEVEYLREAGAKG